MAEENQVAHKSIWDQWPTLLGLLIQTLIFAFFVGILYANVTALQQDVSELKAGFATNDRVDGIEGRVNRIDGRVSDLEKESRHPIRPEETR